MTDTKDPKNDGDKQSAEQEQVAKKIWPKDEPEITAPESDDDDIEYEHDAQETLPSASVEQLEAQLTQSEQLVSDYKNKLARMQADLENIRRRAELDMANERKFGLEKFATEILTVMDSLERGLECKEEIAGDDRAIKVYEGIELTRSLLMRTLERFGVVQMSPINEQFNPKLHEAISMVPSPDTPPNMVIKVMQPGYTLNERLIRPAMVVISK